MPTGGVSCGSDKRFHCHVQAMRWQGIRTGDGDAKVHQKMKGGRCAKNK